MNLLLNQIIADNHAFNDLLDDYKLYGPEPEPPLNYKTKKGFKAVVQDYSSYDLVIQFEHGQISDLCEIPF